MREAITAANSNKAVDACAAGRARARDAIHFSLNNVCAGGTCRGKIVDGGYNISDDASFRFTTQTSRGRTNPRLDTAGL